MKNKILGLALLGLLIVPQQTQSACISSATAKKLMLAAVVATIATVAGSEVSNYENGIWDKLPANIAAGVLVFGITASLLESTIGLQAAANTFCYACNEVLGANKLFA